MSYAKTIRNWRWWVALPVVILVLPIILIDLVSARVVAPAWGWFYEIAHQAFNRVFRWVRSGIKENQP